MKKVKGSKQAEPNEKRKFFVLHGAPIGAPRMTKRDKWKGRPCVQKYFAWRDFCRLVAGTVPKAESVLELNWVAYFEPPESWTKVKREKAIGKLHRSKPDRDNIDKAILDALFEEDSGIAFGKIEKRWGEPARLEIEIIYAMEER